MERTAEIILAEIKEYLQKVNQCIKELESHEPTVQEEEPNAPETESYDPVDLDIDIPEEAQPEAVAEPEPEPIPEPEPEPVPEPEPAPEPIPEPVPEPALEPVPEPEPGPEEEMPAPGPAIIDKVTRKRAWEVDMPGAPVSNILSAISLNDRLLFINTLFKKDPVLFQDTVRLFNGMDSLAEAEDFIQKNHPDWNMESDTVYRFMMAVRRKLS